MSLSKTCTKCKVTKPLTDFYKQAAGKFGVQSECKPCWKVRLATDYQKNRQAVINRTAAYNIANRDAYNERRRKNHLERPELYLGAAQRRRARKNAGGVFRISNQELGRLYKKSCFYCGSTNEITMDHVVPLVRGGRHSIGNLVAACATCNKSKNYRFITEWKLSKKANA